MLGRLLFGCRLLLIAGLSFSIQHTSSRLLYDYPLEDHESHLALKVLTYSAIVDPVGIAIGEYHHRDGVFVSSFQTNSISFVSLDHEDHTQQVEAETIAGGSYDFDSDGSFGTASFAEPSRMAYDDQCKFLFVVGKRNRVIRVLNLEQKSVHTLMKNQDDALTFESNDQYQLNIPGFDIQAVSGDSLYVTDTSMLHRVVVNGNDPYCESISTAAAVISYHSLSYYMQNHDYPYNARISSIIPDSSRSFIYVAISEGKNVILRVPMGAVYSTQSGEITKIVGNEGYSWSGETSVQNPPVAINGMSYDDSVTLSFPMHMQLDEKTECLYWTECFPYVGEFLLGSLTVRRLTLNNGRVDFYAGYDFSQDNETYTEVGTEGGYVNGIVSEAKFRYPVSMAYHGNDVGGGRLYVVDNKNNAIRRVAKVVNTFSPTGVYNPSSHPTASPTQRPTISSEPTATYYPTSSAPSLSIAPTFNPTKRPTRCPTVNPTTQEPTSSTVWVQDNSLFNTMGLGTVHVGLGLYMLSIMIGIILSAIIVFAYTQRHVTPHQHLRTTDHFDEYEDTTEYIGKKCRFVGVYCIYILGMCIPGSAFYRLPHADDDQNQDNVGESGTERSSYSLSNTVTNFCIQLSATFGASEGHDNTSMSIENATTPSNSSSVHNMLQSVRESVAGHQREKDLFPTQSSYTRSTMNPQEYRELNPREQGISGDETNDGCELESLDNSARSTAPMIVRTFGSRYDGL